MDSDLQALINIALLHITGAKWNTHGLIGLSATTVVDRPAGALSLTYYLNATSVTCMISICGKSLHIKILDGKVAEDLYNEKIEELNERTASDILKKVLQEKPDPSKQEDMWLTPGNIMVGSTTSASSFYNEYNKRKEEALARFNEGYKTAQQEENASFLKQLQAIRQKYQGQPAKSRKK